jgi:hypothetical protein
MNDHSMNKEARQSIENQLQNPNHIEGINVGNTMIEGSFH